MQQRPNVREFSVVRQSRSRIISENSTQLLCLADLLLIPVQVHEAPEGHDIYPVVCVQYFRKFASHLLQEYSRLSSGYSYRTAPYEEPVGPLARGFFVVYAFFRAFHLFLLSSLMLYSLRLEITRLNIWSVLVGVFQIDVQPNLCRGYERRALQVNRVQYLLLLGFGSGDPADE